MKILQIGLCLNKSCIILTVNVLWCSKSGKLKAERLLARVSVLEHCSGALPTLTAVGLKTTSPIPDSNGTVMVSYDRLTVYAAITAMSHPPRLVGGGI